MKRSTKITLCKVAIRITLIIITFVLVTIGLREEPQEPLPLTYDLIEQSQNKLQDNKTVVYNFEREVESEPVICFVPQSTAVHVSDNVDSYVYNILPPNTIVTAYPYEGITKIEYNNCIGWITDDLVEYNPELHIDINLDYKHQDLVRELLEIFDLDIDEYIIYGMMYVESRFDPYEESEVMAQGILQITPSTWEYLYDKISEEFPDLNQSYIIKENPFDIKSNITMAMYCLYCNSKTMEIDSESENISQLLTSYNRGVGGTKKFYNTNGHYNSTYAKNVLRASDFIRENKYWEEGI